VTRDQHEEAQSNKIYYDMGIKSGEAIAAEIGLNYEEQKAHKKQDDDLGEIIETVTKLKAAGISSDAAKKLFMRYHPKVEEDIVNTMFDNMEIQKGPNEQKEPEAAKDNDKEKASRIPKAAKAPKVPKPPKP